MSIKFNCPHCQKLLNVKDELAGKRASCPACKKVLTIPAPVAQAVDVEALAAAALSEGSQAEAPKEITYVEFVCAYCDTKVKVDAEMAGKRVPCPECRRITQVPAIEKKDPKDWRRVDSRVPLGAKRDTGPAPEGTWGTADLGHVSRQALVEAKAIVQAKEKVTPQQWAKRIASALVVIAVVGLGTWLVMRYVASSKEAGILARALKAADEGKGKLPAESVAELYRHGGEYYLRSGQADQAKDHFQKARQALVAEVSGSVDRDFCLQSLALSQIDNGGEQAEVIQGTKLKWDDALKESRQSLQNLQMPELRRDAIAALARKLIDKGQATRVQSLASWFADSGVEFQAIIGLELVRAKKLPEAEALANQAQQQLTPVGVLPPVSTPGKPQPRGETPARPAAPAALIALWLALNNPTKAQALMPQAGAEPTQAQQQAMAAANLGTIEGLARNGQVANAEAKARELQEQSLRLQALLAIAEAALDGGQPDNARKSLEDASRLVESEKGKSPPWLLFKLAKLGAAAGLGETLVAITRQIPDSALRGRAQLELLASQLATIKGQAPASLLETFEKGSLAHGLALLSISQHDARQGFATQVEKSVNAAEPEKVRPFGYIGLALALQEHR